MTRPPAGRSTGDAAAIGTGKITRDTVLAAALEIIDAGGADGLSMRRLARALGRDPMILYRHAPNKAVLLDGVAETVLAQLTVDSADPTGPASCAPSPTATASSRRFARSCREILRRVTGNFRTGLQAAGGWPGIQRRESMEHGTLTPRLAPGDDGAERGITRGCRPVRAGRAAAVAVVTLTMVTGCARPASPPAGSDRYQDEVSRNVTATRNLTYGQAPGKNGAPETLTLDLYQPTGDDLAACAPNTVSGSNTVSGCGNVVSGVSNVVQGNYNVVSGVSNTVYGSCLVVSGVGGYYTGNDC